MRIFICDKCDEQFTQPLDQEMYKDSHGDWHSLDLCAPCRKKLKTERQKPEDDFLGKLVNKPKNK